MSVSDSLKIGSDLVDINKPCEVVAALKKVHLQVSAGGQRKTVRFGRDEVTYTSANLSKLESLIAQYEKKCAAQSGRHTSGRARRVRWS